MTQFRTSKKPCKKCGNVIRYSSNNGCVVCAKEKLNSEAAKTHRKNYYMKNREKINNSNRIKYKNSDRYLYALIKRCEKRAKDKNLEFDLSPSDILIPEFCPILGIPLVPSNAGESRDNSPSIDKIDPSKGYVKNNIQIISMKANRIKSNATIADIEKILEYLKGLNR